MTAVFKIPYNGLNGMYLESRFNSKRNKNASVSITRKDEGVEVQ